MSGACGGETEQHWADACDAARPRPATATTTTSEKNERIRRLHPRGEGPSRRRAALLHEEPTPRRRPAPGFAARRGGNARPRRRFGAAGQAVAKRPARPALVEGRPGRLYIGGVRS